MENSANLHSKSAFLSSLALFDLSFPISLNIYSSTAPMLLVPLLLVGWTQVGLCTAAGTTCPTYSCSLVPFTNGTCIVNRGGNFTLYPCSRPNSYCPTDFAGTTSACQLPPPSPTPSPSYIGEPCHSSLPCIQGDCRNERCTGQAAGTKCVNSDSCDTGLRCYQGQCSELMREGEWGCMSDLDCEVQSGCNFLKGRFFGLCTHYFSLLTSSQVTDCVSGRSNLCYSTYCQPQTASPYPLYFCIEAPALQRETTVCKTDEDCMGLSQPWQYEGRCRCGQNAQGTAFCEAFAGDLPGIMVRNTLRDIMRNASATCHTARRLTVPCYHLLNPSLSLQLSHHQLYFTHFPQLQSNDPCVQSIYTAFYWASALPFLCSCLTFF